MTAITYQSGPMQVTAFGDYGKMSLPWLPHPELCLHDPLAMFRPQVLLDAFMYALNELHRQQVQRQTDRGPVQIVCRTLAL